MRQRVVFDTNVVLSALVFDGRISQELRTAWAQCTPLGSSQTIHEINKTLRYPKFKLDEQEAIELLSDYLPLVEIVEVKRRCPAVCRDPDDQKFLDLAHSAKAAVLVSGDRDLLCMSESSGLGFHICTPAKYLES